MSAFIAGWFLSGLFFAAMVAAIIIACSYAGETAEAKKAADETMRHEGWRIERLLANLELLRDLQARFAGLEVMVFGSSLKSGAFRAPEQHPSDIDLMIEVDDETFAAWAARVYDTVGVEAPAEVDYNSMCSWAGHDVRYKEWTFYVHPYSSIHPTREARRIVAQELLGVDIASLDWNVDIFLFPHSFVRGEVSIPAWDGTAPETEGRSFRAEVLAGAKLANLEPHLPE